MTDRDSDTRREAHLNAGDVSPETEQLSSEETAQMHVSPGRGGGAVDGADPSDEQVDEHVSGETQPGASNAGAGQKP